MLVLLIFVIANIGSNIEHNKVFQIYFFSIVQTCMVIFNINPFTCIVFSVQDTSIGQHRIRMDHGYVLDVALDQT